MGDVVHLPVVRIALDHGPGNGAREAILRVFPESNMTGIDMFLGKLWLEGFKVVPLEAGDEAPYK